MKLDEQIAELSEATSIKQVHRDIVRLRAGATGEQIEAINSRVRLNGLPSHFTGYDRISESGYFFNRADIQFRVANYLSKGLDFVHGCPKSNSRT